MSIFGESILEKRVIMIVQNIKDSFYPVIVDEESRYDPLPEFYTDTWELSYKETRAIENYGINEFLFLLLDNNIYVSLHNFKDLQLYYTIRTRDWMES